MLKLKQMMHDSGVLREDFFINYKIFPKIGKDQFLQNVDNAIMKYGYVNCIMLHEMFTDEYGGQDQSQIIAIFKSLENYVKMGKVRCLGVSNCNLVELRELAEQFPDITIVQNAFNHTKQDDRRHVMQEQAFLSFSAYGWQFAQYAII